MEHRWTSVLSVSAGVSRLRPGKTAMHWNNWLHAHTSAGRQDFSALFLPFAARTFMLLSGKNIFDLSLICNS